MNNWKNWGLGIGLFAMYYLNYLGSATDKLGVKIADLASIFPFKFMPPGWAFMISRGTIFISLLIFFIIFIFQKVPSSVMSHVHEDTRMWMGASIILNIGWLLATGAGYYVLSVVFIFALAFVLYRLLLHLRESQQKHTWGRFSWGVYFGWIQVAAGVIGLSQVVYTYYPTFALSNTWAYIALGIGLLKVSTAYYIVRNNYAFAWSLLAIAAAGYAMMGG